MLSIHNSDLRSRDGTHCHQQDYRSPETRSRTLIIFPHRCHCESTSDNAWTFRTPAIGHVYANVQVLAVLPSPECPHSRSHQLFAACQRCVQLDYRGPLTCNETMLIMLLSNDIEDVLKRTPFSTSRQRPRHIADSCSSFADFDHISEIDVAFFASPWATTLLGHF